MKKLTQDFYKDKGKTIAYVQGAPVRECPKCGGLLDLVKEECYEDYWYYLKCDKCKIASASYSKASTVLGEEDMAERGKVLDEAKTVINGERQDQYGNPEDNFTTIAELWSAYKGTTITPLDVAIMMSLLKIARISTGTDKRDSYVDCAGYIGLAADIAMKE